MFLQTSGDIVRRHPELEAAVKFIDSVLEETSTAAILDPRQLARGSGIDENQVESVLDLLAESGDLRRIEVAECDSCHVLVECPSPALRLDLQLMRCTRCDQHLGNAEVLAAYRFSCRKSQPADIRESLPDTKPAKSLESPGPMPIEITKHERGFLMDLLRGALPNKDAIENFVAGCSQHKYLRGGMKYEPLDTAYRLLIDLCHSHHKLGDVLFELSETLDRDDIATVASHFVSKYQESSSHSIAKGFFNLKKRALEGVTRDDAFIGSGRLLNLIQNAERRICKVRCRKSDAGTGFLVGDNLVLTCFHVIEIKDQWRNGTGKLHSSSDISVQFDFVERDDGSVTPTNDYWVDPKWNIRASTYSKADLTYPPGEPAITELDYAVLKLEDNVAKESVNGKERGYFLISKDQTLPPVNTRIVIAGHPGPHKLQPLQVSVESSGLEGTTINQARIIYKTSTQPGSSGSPVFDFECNVIGLHHAPGIDDPGKADRHLNNRGINISLIAKEIADLLLV